ncbi:MAG: hypothetical protein AUK53_08315 [Betaproteobacteria bacterium CG2_30_59_46]|nr:MAG: hypothetical protein AUK53_08315 [Betaproteobacteria bacterium CG2_30_59_46]
MRVIQNTQMHIGEVDISTITLDPKSRDDIPHILRGLQHLYVDQGLRAQLFHLLETDIAPKIDKRTGNVRHLKRHLRRAQNRKHRKAHVPAQQERNDARVIEAHAAYLDVARQYLDKARATLAAIGAASASGGLDLAARSEIEGFMQHARRQIDQTQRRVIRGEAIPHAEKVFSVFEPHTE